ncbi:MAG: NRPS condensation-like uncharacterized protein [Bacteroidia bacterium]|jgi:NRPS condensation-like uncharacterized protein
MTSVSLSGSDYFHLLIDRKMKRFGLAGNISRVHFQLSADTDLDALAARLKSNTYLQKAASAVYKLRWPFLPKWELSANLKPQVLVTNSLTETEFHTHVLNRTVDNQKGLVCIDLCTLNDATKHLVVSMHHVLFDHQGMMNFIGALNNDFDGEVFPENVSSSVAKKALNAIRMTSYMLSQSSSKLGSLLDKKPSSTSAPVYQFIAFTADESKQIEQNAWQAGSRIGTSTYLISAIAKCVENILKSRNQKPPYLWFSTPHKERKIGAKGHLFSNQLSFLFFKLKSDDLNSNETAVDSLNGQLKLQIKNQITAKYSDLMDALRLTPLFVYEQMVDVASNGKLASFGFSDLGIDQLQLNEFCGAKVERVFRYPPVPTPPGFNVAVVRSSEQFQFVFGYVEEALKPKEMDRFLTDFKNQLLNGNT